MLTKRIIPCLDVRNGRTVKGVNFESLRDVGDPIELGRFYSESGADELVFLDITASQENRNVFLDLVLRIAEQISIPFTVGGGINTVDNAADLLRSGADKISINSAAIANPQLISNIAQSFGNQCVVVAIDARLEDGEWVVYRSGGTCKTNKELFSWAAHVVELGAGEILFTSMDHDGTKDGFACEALNKLTGTVNVPIIASGGAGNMQHFVDAFTKGKVDAALAASVFHYGTIGISKLKQFLSDEHICVRGFK